MFQLHFSLLSNGPSHFVSAGGSKEGVWGCRQVLFFSKGFLTFVWSISNFLSKPTLLSCN